MPINNPTLAPHIQQVEACAADLGIDPLVIFAMILVESSGNPNARNSSSGASGLLGVMPREAGHVFRDRPTSQELLDPTTNIEWGCRILGDYLRLENGDIQRALMRYSGFLNHPWDDYIARYWSKIEREIAKLKEESGQMQIIDLESVHRSPRLDGEVPLYIIVHSTVTPINGSLASTAQYLRQNDRTVSVHELVGAGVVYRMVPDNKVAYHTGNGTLPNGASKYQANAQSWGIEALQFTGRDTAPDVVETLIQRIVEACKRLGIPASNVLGHREVDPKRRKDPVGVDMTWLRGEVAKRLEVATTPDPLIHKLIALRWEGEEALRETARGDLAAVEARLRDRIVYPLSQMINEIGGT